MIDCYNIYRNILAFLENYNSIVYSLHFYVTEKCRNYCDSVGDSFKLKDICCFGGEDIESKINK